MRTKKSLAMLARGGEYRHGRGGLERPNKVVFANDGRTMYVVDYGEVFTDFYKTPPFYTVPKSGVIWTISYEGATD